MRTAKELPLDLPPVLYAGGVLTRAALLQWYREREPGLPVTTLDWRLHELVRLGVLVRRARGHYARKVAAGVLPTFQPQVPDELAALWQRLRQHLGEDVGCVWTTGWLHDWMRHQPGRALLVVEVPRALLATAFYFLLEDRGGSGVFLDPDEPTTTIYVAEAAQPLLVLPLVTRAPVQRQAGVPVPKLEKLLVDVFADPIRLAAYQGAELRRIFEMATRQYALDPVTLGRYADRRGRAEELRAWLERQQDPALRRLLADGHFAPPD